MAGVALLFVRGGVVAAPSRDLCGRASCSRCESSGGFGASPAAAQRRGASRASALSPRGEGETHHFQYLHAKTGSTLDYPGLSPERPRFGRRTAGKAAKSLSDKNELKERNRQVLIDHLADFVVENQQWLGGKFPTRDYLSKAGRIDLAEAIRKLGGPAKVADMFGLKWGNDSIPTTGWNAAAKMQSGLHNNGADINILDKESLERSIAEIVDKGNSFMVEHTTSKTPMKESEWTLWRPPISADTTEETVEYILQESERCSNHHPSCYVRITAFDKVNLSRKITFLLHEPKNTAAS